MAVRKSQNLFSLAEYLASTTAMELDNSSPRFQEESGPVIRRDMQRGNACMTARSRMAIASWVPAGLRAKVICAISYKKLEINLKVGLVWQSVSVPSSLSRPPVKKREYLRLLDDAFIDCELHLARTGAKTPREIYIPVPDLRRRGEAH